MVTLRLRKVCDCCFKIADDHSVYHRQRLSCCSVFTQFVKINDRSLAPVLCNREYKRRASDRRLAKQHILAVRVLLICFQRVDRSRGSTDYGPAAIPLLCQCGVTWCKESVITIKSGLTCFCANLVSTLL